MRKIFSFPMIGCLALLAAAGCARDKKPDAYRSSVLEDLPFVYKMTVQQGNILTEEMLDGLTPGMTKRQVSFLLGTPLLTDFFHSDRWDYAYTIQRGHQPMEKRFLTLRFQNDALTRIEGDLHPNARRRESGEPGKSLEPGMSREPKEIVVSVPDYEERQGLLTKSLKTIGLDTKD
jgi:outer membrane protein assembly factor BamE